MRVCFYDENDNLIFIDVLNIIYCPLNEKYYCSGLRGVVHIIDKSKLQYIHI